MGDLLSNLFEKLSAYQLLNYLFPGIVFNLCVDHIMSFSIAPDEILYRIIVYYITGMILSRIGSTIIEPLYKKVCIVVYAKYKNFLDASAKDSKLDILVLENNTYRTLLSIFISVFLLFIIDQIQWLHGKYEHPIAIIIYLLLLILLFSLSFRKQTDFIRRRVHRDLDKTDKDEIEKLKEEQKKINILNQILLLSTESTYKDKTKTEN